jgi:hypothetical protein
MMRFLPACPKCESTAISMERDPKWSGMGWPKDALFHCFTCGHRLYGSNAVAHTTLEQARHEADEARRAQEALAEIERQHQRQRQRQWQRQRDEEERLRRERKVISSQCAWGECRLSRREKSIYCSRNCSNKNARARHAARQ